MDSQLKRSWKIILVATGVFVIAISLLLFILPYQVNAYDLAIFYAVQPEAKSYTQQTIALTATNTYTYWFPLIFQNYHVPTWQLLGLTGSEVKDIAIDPKIPGVLYAVTADTQGVFKSADFGKNWYQISNGLRDDGILAQVVVDSLHSSKIYVTAFNYPRFYRSENSGQSWQPGGDIPLIPKTLSSHPTTTEQLFVGVGGWDIYGGGGWVCRSTDGGLNWTVVITQQVLATSIATSVLDPTFMYVGGNGLYRSQDGGDSFVSLTSRLPSSQIEAVVIHPTNPLTAYVSTEAGIFKTNDGGDNWLWWSDRPSDQIQKLLVNHYNPETQYIASRNCEGVFISRDEGRHWHHINTGLDSLCINDLEANEEFTHLYAATANGIWTLDLMDGAEQ